MAYLASRRFRAILLIGLLPVSGCFGGSGTTGAGNGRDASALDAALVDAAGYPDGDSTAADVDLFEGSTTDASAPEPEAAPTDSMSDVPGEAGEAGLMCTDAGVDDAGQGFCGGARIGLLGVPGPNASSNFQAWLGSNGQVVTRVPTATVIAADVLSSFDVVILDQLERDYTTSEADALRDWVAGGGGVMSMTGYTGAGPDQTQPNTLLASIGIQYLPGLYSGPVTMFASHPTTSGLTSVTFLGGYTVGPVAGITGGVDTVTASLSAGPVAIAQERGLGRVYAWGDEWVEYDSEWASIPQIRQFWVDVLGWLEHLR
jgi:hypothetical protein